MALNLQEILKHEATTIVKIDEKDGGGTYLRFWTKIDLIPNNPGRAWYCWARSYLDESAWTVEEENERVVEVIVKKSPFDFLQIVFGCKPEDVWSWDPFDKRVIRFRRVKYGRFEFDTESQLAEPCEGAQQYFAVVLSQIRPDSMPVLEENRKLLERCRKDTLNPRLRVFAVQFKLEKFYRGRIGDAVRLSDLVDCDVRLTKDDIRGIIRSVPRPASEDELCALVSAFS